MAKTPDNKRKAAERERMRERGFKRFEAYVHPDDWPAVRDYIERKRKERVKAALKDWMSK
jgi:hypothetical protein